MDAQQNGHTNASDILVFHVGEVLCGVDIAKVREINRNTEVTRVFTAAPHIRGVINLRGEIVTIVDVARRLGIESFCDDLARKNVVVVSRGETVGLRVDDIDDIVTPQSGMLPPPQHLPESILARAVGVISVERGLVVVLDVDATAA